MTERDIKILEYLTQVRVSTTEQIRKIFFAGLHHSVVYRRLQILVDSKLIKRSRYRIDNKNIYVYYLDNKPSKRNIKHDLLITEAYVKLSENDFRIIEFHHAPTVAGIIPDAIIKFKRINNQEIKEMFLEVQLSAHNCISKYFNIKSKTNKDIPKTLYIVTDQKIKYTQLRDLKVVIDNTDFKKLGFYFS